MRNLIFLVASLAIFALLNYSIWEKEKIKANGETVFLALRPADPRSLLQGDYMRLRYAIESSITHRKDGRGHAVISAVPDRAAGFVRVYAGEELKPGEKLLRFHISRYGQARIVPDSFMFQEGNSALYSQAKYAIFKFHGPRDSLLVGLADESLKPIEQKD